MTKKEAREILYLEARYHKILEYTPEMFKQKLEEQHETIPKEVLEAYELLKDDFVHFVAIVWRQW